MQRLLNIPSKQDDTATVLQAISKLVADKFNKNSNQEALEDAKKSNKIKEVHLSKLF